MVSRIKSLIASRCDRHASNHPAYKVIKSLLVPRCALCDTVHLSPNRLCGDCITSLECHHRQTPSSSDAVVARDSLAHPSAVGLPRTQHQSQGNAFIPDVRRLDSAFYYPPRSIMVSATRFARRFDKSRFALASPTLSVWPCI